MTDRIKIRPGELKIELLEDRRVFATFIVSGVRMP